MLEIVRTDDGIELTWPLLDCGQEAFRRDQDVFVCILVWGVRLVVVPNIEANVPNIRAQGFEEVRRIVTASDVEHVGARD
jgi:hypothetical protein